VVTVDFSSSGRIFSLLLSLTMEVGLLWVSADFYFWVGCSLWVKLVDILEGWDYFCSDDDYFWDNWLLKLLILLLLLLVYFTYQILVLNSNPAYTQHSSRPTTFIRTL
jgi:hypothetical protein